MRKTAIALAAALFLVSGVAAADSNTTELWNTTDLNISDTYTGDAFTADSLENLTVNASIGTNESLDAVITGYNSMEQTSNQTFTLSDGVTEKSISSFSENTTTYTVKFKPVNGSVQVHEASVTGVETNATISPAAPGGPGFITGAFSAMGQGIADLVKMPFEIAGQILQGLKGFIGGLIPW